MAQRSFTYVLGEELKISLLFSTARQCHGSVGKPTPRAGLLRAFLPLSLGLPECHARTYTRRKREGHF